MRSLRSLFRQPGIVRIILALFMFLLYAFLAWRVGLAPSLDASQGIRISDSDAGALRFFLGLSPPMLEVGGGPVIEIRSMDYQYHGNPSGPLPDEICMDEITLIQAGEDYNLSFGTGRGQTLCYPLEIKSRTDEDETGQTEVRFTLVKPEDAENLSISLGASPSLGGWNPYWYPYDRFDLAFRFEVHQRLMRQGQVLTTTVSNPVGNIRIPDTAGWVVQMGEEITPMEFHPLRDKDKFVPLHFKRPLFDQVIFPAVILVVLFFILLLSLADSVTVFIGGGVAVFFGIFGLSQILLPRAAQVHTIVDVAIWGLYFAFAGALVHHLVSELRGALRKAKSEPVKPDPEPDLSTEPPVSEDQYHEQQ